MIIVVTGASKGIGKAIAEQFASDKQGHTVFVCSRNAEQIELTRKELQGRFPRTNIYGHAVDLSVKEEVLRYASLILQQTDKIDILVNNAGLFEPGNVHDEPEGTLEAQLNTNLFSAYHLTRALLPTMMAKKSGHIFNMCSIAAMAAYPNGGSYSISKFALHGFTKNLREEMKPHGIKVTAVHPGAVLTDSWAGFDNSQKRIMEASDIAKMIYASAHLSPQACVEEIVIRPQLGDL